MLVLTRRRGESIVVGKGEGLIIFKIIGVKGSQITVGVAAPRHVPVDRQEVRIQKDMRPK